jgi:glycosyltransferase
MPLQQSNYGYAQLILDEVLVAGVCLVQSHHGRRHRSRALALAQDADNGIYDALNKGIKASTGDVVGFLHADDFFSNADVLTTVANAFNDSSVCAVYGDMVYTSQMDTTKVVRHWKSSKWKKSDLYLGWMPAHPTLYVRREWFASIGGFDVNYKISADYLSILQMFLHPNFKTVYIPQVLVKMRLGGASNKSFKAVVQKTKEDWRALRSCGFTVLKAARAIVLKNLSKLIQFI